MKAIIAGATGLVGTYLLEMLLADDNYGEVCVLTRRELNLGNQKVREVVTGFENLKDSLKEIEADHVFCCLGTTMKKAGTKKNFIKVDLEYPLKLAEIMLEKKAGKYLLVSALGASTKSIFFYNRVKGEVEKAIRSLAYPSLYIFRPSLLLGERKEKRTGEDIAKKTYKYLDRLFIGPFKRYKGIHAKTVAYAMINMAKSGPEGTVILESDQVKSHLKKIH